MIFGVTLSLGIFLFLYLFLRKIPLENKEKSKFNDNISTDFVN